MIRKWLPSWVCSHAQIADPNLPSIQSRSWDIVVHKPVPAEWGYPNPSTPYGGYPLIPKSLCCAVIDSKGNLDCAKLRKYCRQPAFNVDRTCLTRQLDFLDQGIMPIAFLVTAWESHESIAAEARNCGINAYVLAQMKYTKHNPHTGKPAWRWRLQGASDQPPLRRFQHDLIEAAKHCESSHVQNAHRLGPGAQ